MFGPGPFAWPGRRRRRFKRGMVKYVILKVLESGERHGYDLMRHFDEKGWGRLAAGTLYPVLSALEEHGLIAGRDEDGKRTYRITDLGRQRLRDVVFDIEDELEPDEDQPENRGELREAMQKMNGAIMQAAHNAKPETVTKIAARLNDVRKEIYTMLANE